MNIREGQDMIGIDDFFGVMENRRCEGSGFGIF
jgi:hypothetical protein